MKHVHFYPPSVSMSNITLSENVSNKTKYRSNGSIMFFLLGHVGDTLETS